MKLIVGLGNPGQKYEKNRHNIGYMVCDQFAISEGDRWERDKIFLSIYSAVRPYMLVKPTIFMNQSGEVVGQIARWRKINAGDILVVHDELDLAFSKIRLSFGGSAAGHRGVESIIKSLGTADFARLRIGIGSPRKVLGGAGKSEVDVEGYVLEDFTAVEQKDLPSVIKASIEAIKVYLNEGISATMNRYN